MQLRPRERTVTQQAVAARRSTRVAKETVRYASPEDDFDDSEISELSSSPTPLPELAYLSPNNKAWKIPHLSTYSSSSPLRSRGSNGRFLSAGNRKRNSNLRSDDESKELKRQRRDSLLGDDATADFELSERIVESVEPVERVKPVKSVEPVPSVEPVGLAQQPQSFASSASPLGLFSLIPREIRDIVYGCAVEVTQSVRPRSCCGIQSTTRERNSCPKHGKKTPDSGRFSLLLVSKEIAAEASYVLHSFTKLELPIDKSIAPYLRDHVPKTMRRLGALPKDERVKAMWLSAARYRSVEISFFRDATRDMETAGVGNIVNACALLLRARQDVNTKAFSTHNVTINLGSLFEDVVPFGPVDLFSLVADDLTLWVMNIYWRQEEYLSELSTKAGNALKKLVELIKQHRGCSRWTLAAGADIDDDRKEARRWFRVLKSDCEKGGMEFMEL